MPRALRTCFSVFSTSMLEGTLGARRSMMCESPLFWSMEILPLYLLSSIWQI